MIFLFGDRHWSKENYCSQCTCSSEKKSCCYELSDHSFLKLIDNMASKYPIDFYTETFFVGTESGFKGGMMEPMTTGDMISCYNRHLKNTKDYHCPTENIRWQAGDIRYAGEGRRGRVFEIKSNKFMNKSYIEYQLHNILDKIFWIFKYKGKYNYKDLIKLLRTSLKESYFKNFKNFKVFLLNLFDGNNIDYKKFASKLFSFMINDTTSAIYKQVRKQTYGDFNVMKKWEEFYARSMKNYFDNYLSKYYKQIEIKNFISNLDLFVNKKLSFTTTDMVMFEQIYIFITQNLLDIYVISRIFKQPENGKRSDLSFCYFGDVHIINMKDLLLSTGIYEIVSSKNELIIRGESNRCIEFKDVYINLDKELKNHNSYSSQ